MRCKPSFFSAIAIGTTILVIAPAMLASPVTLTRQPHQSSWKISQLPQTASLIYVSPRPNPNGDGSLNNPYPSIAAALATKPVAGTVIQLQQGVYSAETGETFPLRLPTGVMLRGEPSVRGINTVIQGGGKFISPSFASQNITLLAENDARIEGITVTNPNTRGTAVWVESGKRVAIANNTFANSDREGIFLTGTADATISENLFRKNGANGLSAVGSSTGEIRNNIFDSTGFGLAIGQKSRVNVTNNNILNNTDGIVISNLSAPTLRNNVIADNQRNGIVILKDRKGYPTPDLGTSNNLGKNIFRNNLEKDLNNNSGVTQVAVGNELDPKKIAGDIAFVGASPTAPLPEVAITPLAPVVTSTSRSPVSTNTTSNPASNPVEITRSPQPTINQPIANQPTTQPVVTPSSIFIEPLPDVPQSITNPNSSSIANTETVTATPVNNPTTSTTNFSDSPNEVLIDRDPVPVTPPVNIPKSQFIPNNQPSPNIPTTSVQTPSTVTPSVATKPIPYNAKIAALVPPPAKDTTPYLVIIPSSEDEVLNRVRSAVPSAKVVPSRFGNIIMVQGYPDRDRAEVLKVIMRSAIGLDARVIHQNSL